MNSVYPSSFLKYPTPLRQPPDAISHPSLLVICYYDLDFGTCRPTLNCEYDVK